MHTHRRQQWITTGEDDPNPPPTVHPQHPRPGCFASVRNGQLRNSIPYFAAIALKSIAGPCCDGLPLSVIDVTTSSMKASKIPPGELMINSRPVSEPMLLTLWGVPLGANIMSPGPSLSISSPS